MGRRSSSAPEILDDFDQSASKELLPNAIDRRAGRQGILGTGQPLSEFQSIVNWLCAEDCRDSRFDLLTVTQEIPANKQPCFPVLAGMLFADYRDGRTRNRGACLFKLADLFTLRCLVTHKFDHESSSLRA